ncbi:MAG: ComF family protein [Oscillospiraceae bacterium]
MSVLGFINKLLFPTRCPFCNVVLGFVPKCTKCFNALASIKHKSGEPIEKAQRELKFIDTALTVYEYKPPVRDAILRFKFANRTDLAKDFAKELFMELKACKTLPKFDIIISVPSGKRELKNRGYDVPALLAKELSLFCNVRHAENAICKPIDTKPQMKLTKDMRKANLLGAFSVAEPSEVIGANILLVDDVITTGATMNECAKTLLIAGAKSCSCISVALA